MEELITKLSNVSDDLTDGNFHSEAAFIDALVDVLESDPDISAKDLVKFIAEHDWMAY
jgi:hypothetical protein